MMDEWMERQLSLFNNLVCNRNGFSVKGALRSFGGGKVFIDSLVFFVFFLPKQTKLTNSQDCFQDWINKLTLKDNTVSYCCTLFEAGKVAGSATYYQCFPLRTACYGKIKYKKTTECPFNLHFPFSRQNLHSDSSHHLSTTLPCCSLTNIKRTLAPVDMYIWQLFPSESSVKIWSSHPCFPPSLVT